MIRGNQQDELIFDYLEGNLSAEETEALQILQDESELFDREVRLWQNTYLEAELPVIADLEQRLLIQASPIRGSVAGRVSTAMLILLAILVIPAGRNEFVVDIPWRAAYTIPHPSKEAELPEVYPDCIEEMASTPGQGREEGRTSTSAIVITLPVALSELPLRPLVEPANPRLNGIAIEQTASGKTFTKKWSKRELRLLRKKRWQTIELRRESEFQKGRVPYVVPLNNNNF